MIAAKQTVLTSAGALLALALALTVPASANAQPGLKGKTYYFGTHAARTNITFVSEADIETIHGVSHAAKGSLAVDTKGTTVSGTLSIPVASLKTGIALRDEHLRSDAWLHAKKYPWIRLQIISATENKANPKLWNYTANLTIKNITKRISGTTKVSAIPDRFSAALGGGSWVRVRASFNIRLKDYGIVVPQRIGAKVNTTWKVGIDMYGTTAAPTRKKRS